MNIITVGIDLAPVHSVNDSGKPVLVKIKVSCRAAADPPAQPCRRIRHRPAAESDPVCAVRSAHIWKTCLVGLL